jgi:electron transfer flavoprotein beta subunit
MKILVCLKQILDPEIPSRDFQIDRDTRQAVRGSANLVTNIFCENALETALQLQEKTGGEITALSFGPDTAEDTLRKALALKADRAYLVMNTGIPHSGSLATAKVLAAAIGKIDSFDLIMVGREAGDWGAGQTAGLLAEELHLPCVSFVDAIQQTSEGVELNRQTQLGWERLTARPPLVVSITNNDQNVPRIPKTRDIMTSSRKPLIKWNLSDIGLTLEEVATLCEATEIVDLFIPEKQSECQFMSGDSLDERISTLARRIVDEIQA